MQDLKWAHEKNFCEKSGTSLGTDEIGRRSWQEREKDPTQSLRTSFDAEPFVDNRGSLDSGTECARSCDYYFKGGVRSGIRLRHEKRFRRGSMPNPRAHLLLVRQQHTLGSLGESLQV